MKGKNCVEKYSSDSSCSVVMWGVGECRVWMQKSELVFQYWLTFSAFVRFGMLIARAKHGKCGVYSSWCRDDNGCFYFTLLGRHLSKAMVVWESMESEWNGCVLLFGPWLSKVIIHCNRAWSLRMLHFYWNVNFSGEDFTKCKTCTSSVTVGIFLVLNLILGF